MPSPIYSLRVVEVYQTLESSPNGISAEEAESRRSLYGSNLIRGRPKPSQWLKLIAHAIHPMALLLWAAGVVAFVLGEFILGFFIWSVVLINALLTYWQENRAENQMEALNRLLPSYARVLREGADTQIPASDVVPGDVLVLAEGDNISADARVVEEFGLRVNNATLTGEPVPARKTSDASLREGISELERPNLVFAGTSVVSGTGRAVVYATGTGTQFGRIAQLTEQVKEQPSQLQREIARITRTIAVVAIGIGVVVFIVGVLEVSLGLRASFLLALGIIVAALPEGLPATITLTLAMAAQRLAQRGVLVKKLSIVETLGGITILCTDKSGTLTQNQMTVREVWVARRRLAVSGVGYEPKGSFSPNPGDSQIKADLNALLVAAMLCNNSRLLPPAPERPHWSYLGDQTEAALRVAALKGGGNEKTILSIYPRVHELPFDARRKRMSTIHRHLTRREFGGDAVPPGMEIAFVKGAPREVLQLCTHILIDGAVHPLEDNVRTEILSANDEYARNALRVLALARRELPPKTTMYTTENVERNLVFLGLTAMMDPPRAEVADAVSILKQAGIRMVMITGDYGLTAESLARRIGMLSTSTPTILTGAELDELNDHELTTLLNQEVIFARMAPEHKLRLVAAYQASGHVVAVTGDGVNDAPALRKADVGVSMGLVGADVAREAADIVLIHDNFASIVAAIEEGRAVFDNLRKFITYIFSSNTPEILPFIMSGLVGIPLALSVKQILAIDLGTDLFPALALGTEKPEPDVMQRPPRPRSKPLMDRGLLARSFFWLGIIEAVLCYVGFFYVYLAAGVIKLSDFSFPQLKYLPEIMGTAPTTVVLTAMTVFHAGVVMAQVGNAFACRSEKQRGRRLGWLSNRLLLGGVAIEIAIILSLIYIPPLYNIFNHVPLPYKLWIGLGSFPVILYTLEWIRKSFVRRLEALGEQKSHHNIDEGDTYL